jgi:hypothetical protein
LGNLETIEYTFSAETRRGLNLRIQNGANELDKFTKMPRFVANTDTRGRILAKNRGCGDG